MELISAIATAQGAGGVSIIRVSGEGAFSLARNMFSHRGEFEPYRMYPGRIDCGTFSDFGMCVCFRAPHSFTGEDVAEFHCHGGTAESRSRAPFTAARWSSAPVLRKRGNLPAAPF